MAGKTNGKTATYFAQKVENQLRLSVLEDSNRK